MSTKILEQLGTRTLLMGILNCTPDSFSDGGAFLSHEAALTQARKLIDEGADILDIGGESSRPGADPTPLEDERQRVIPVIKKTRKDFPDLCISVDTYKSQIAQEALDAGADLINDISALRFDDQMAYVVAESKCPVILMHMQGTPKTMMENPHYDDVVADVIQFLRARIDFAKSNGISSDKIIIDPGFGFGKRPQHNTAILKRLLEFKVLKKPILLGTSRKSFLGAITKRPVQERLEETIASAVAGVLNGADIVRVHDVKAVKNALLVADALR
ncbi:dihydropteroate synthase [Candidatus Acetothermia bacterium]|nr:dihydropteroate synthase [Candidatus Acetothermia bacterium]MBI3642995.1 dihydropteroate synthase [Candidatus Acetothermia bacterium]